MDDNFINDVSKFIDKANGNLRLTVLAFIQDLNTTVIVSSPGPGNSVAKHAHPRGPTGFLRGSWFAAFDSPQAGKGVPDPAGGSTVARCNLVASQIQPGQTYYLVNNASYARRLEYGFIGKDSLGRYYNQAGRFWVRSAVMKAPLMVQEAAERVARGEWSSPTGGISGGAFTRRP